MEINFLLHTIFLLFKIISYIHCRDSLIYPYSITLSNENIFIVHKFGIDIYDSFFRYKTKAIIEFSDEDQLTEEAFSKLILKYDYGYILSIINDKLYIFNDTGEVIYISNDTIIENQKPENYALVIFEPQDNKLNCLIGYFDVNIP